MEKHIKSGTYIGQGVYIPLACNIKRENGVFLTQTLRALALELPAPEFVAGHETGNADHERACDQRQHIPPADIHGKHSLSAHTGNDGQVHNPYTQRNISQLCSPGLARRIHTTQDDGYDTWNSQHCCQLYGHI